MNTAAPSGPADKSPARIAVIGGGISGLAAAHRLLSLQPNCHVTLFECSRRLGGIIRTEEADGFLMELGPDSFITNKPAAITLCEELNYLPQLTSTDARYRRSLVLSKGRPLPVPDGFMLMAPEKPLALLKSPVLSIAGRLRLLAEFFIPPKPANADESLASFVRRRFGSEALDRLVQPLVGGIYTADPERLSLKATLPRFLEMEASHGSIIRACLAQRRAPRTPDQKPDAAAGSGARYGLFAAPAHGLGDLVAALEQFLRKCPSMHFQLGTPVLKVTPTPQSTTSQSAPPHTSTPPLRWQLQTASHTAEFDAVIITLPAWAAAEILDEQQLTDLRYALKTIPYASSAIVVSGHQLADFTHPMDAFGLVIPAIEKRQILAVSFSSRKFQNRAPDGHIVLRTFLGGAMQPEILQLDNQAILNAVNQELTQIFGMKREPLFAEVVRYPNAMPQYEVGHADRIARIEKHLAACTGLRLAGSGYYGVGIPDSIASGRSAAEHVLNGVN
ncbi:MAG: Protoporphyrinogen oxidase [Planctomycetota bacterium]